MLHNWMYVVGELQDAIDDCESDCRLDACNDDQVNSWDVGVAVYTGSVSKLSLGDGGHTLYTLAQQSCREFGTCVENGLDVGMANANQRVFQQFHAGQQHIVQGTCIGARESAERITELMTIPLIQGTLKYAHKMDKQNDQREESEAEGATSAAAVLPLLNACNSDDADIVYNNMRVGNGATADFDVVKTAFERNYNCLGITCEDVGGLVNLATGEYWPGAEPCGFSVESSNVTATSKNMSNEEVGGKHEENLPSTVEGEAATAGVTSDATSLHISCLHFFASVILVYSATSSYS